MEHEQQPWRKTVAELWKKYRWLVLMMSFGVLLLLLPTGKEAPPTDSRTDRGVPELPATSATERRLEEALSKISGAGQVRVVLTLKSGPRQVLAQDCKTSRKEGDTDVTSTTVILNQSDRGQQPIPLQQFSPQFQGALVVCSGGEDPVVRLNLTEAVSVLTGLSADKISICKGK